MLRFTADALKRVYPFFFLRKISEEIYIQYIKGRKLENKGGPAFAQRKDFEGFKSKTAFILGSGTSINSLTDENWVEISNNLSIGLNWWILHKFVPNIYSSEFPRGMAKEATYNRECILSHLVKRKQDYCRSKILLRGMGTLDYLLDGRFYPISSNVKLCLSPNILGDTGKEIERYTALYSHLIRASRFLRIGPLFPSGTGSSILFLTILSYLLGCTKVVLCGVDLNHSTYFFEEENARLYCQNALLPHFEQKSAVHLTHDAKYMPGGLTLKDRLLMLNSLVFKKDKMEILTGSPDSALYPEFESYRWNCKR